MDPMDNHLHYSIPPNGGGVAREDHAEVPLDKPQLQVAFKDSMIREILQFTLQITFCCILLIVGESLNFICTLHFL